MIYTQQGYDVDVACLGTGETVSELLSKPFYHPVLEEVVWKTEVLSYKSIPLSADPPSTR